MLIKVQYKTIETPSYLEYVSTAENFTPLPPKGLVTFTFGGDISKNQAEQLKQNTKSDITFEISNLEINGVKTDNVIK